MQNSLKRKPASLSQKLKGALTDLSTDIFGYEKKISSNIINRAHHLSDRFHLRMDNIAVVIYQKNDEIRAFLFEKDKPIAILPMEELAYFFVDPHTANLINAKTSIPLNIKRYLKDYASQKMLFEESITIRISVKENKVLIKSYTHCDFVESLSLLSLIKYFR